MFARTDFYLPVLDVWVDDNQFVLDRLEALNAGEPAGRFTTRLDLAAVGAFGHLLGGRDRTAAIVREGTVVGRLA